MWYSRLANSDVGTAVTLSTGSPTDVFSHTLALKTS